METIVELLQKHPDLICGTGASDSAIEVAEKELGLKFAPDYKLYLRKFGLVAFDGRELTGLGAANHVNVVTVTKNLRENSCEIPTDFYVIEETGIDGLTIFQNSEGHIYQSFFNGKPERIYNSLYEYLAH